MPCEKGSSERASRAGTPAALCAPAESSGARRRATGRTLTDPTGRSMAASTKTTSRARRASSASSGRSWSETITDAPVPASRVASRSPTSGPTASSPRSVLPQATTSTPRWVGAAGSPPGAGLRPAPPGAWSFRPPSAGNLAQQGALGVADVDLEWHLPDGVGGTAEARVVAADHRLHTVEHPLLDLIALDVVPGRLEDAPVHRQVVVAGGDDPVGPLHQAVVVHVVVVDEHPARRLGDTHALVAVDLGARPHVRVEDVGPGEDVVDHVDAVDDLDEPRVVVVEGAGRVAPQPLAVLGELGVGRGGAETLGDVEPGQRADAA